MTDNNKQDLPSISVGGPEHEPVKSGHEAIHEVIEHTPDKEVLDHIETIPEVVPVSEELKEMGVESTATSMFTTVDPKHLPLSDAQIFAGEKAPPSTAIRWLSEICLKALKKINQTLKLIHGKVTRVPSN